MARKIFGIALLFFVSFIAKATHQVAGYITFKWISGTTYEVTIYDYTNTYGTSADRDTMRLWYGDGTSDLLDRLYGPIDQYGFPNGVPLCNYDGTNPLNGARKINVYHGTHTYPGPGSYSAWFDDPDRMANISNIPSSVNVEFYIHNTLVIQPFASLYDINTPIIVNPPVCLHGCTGQCYYYNPGAYSPDGDSLVYALDSSLTMGRQIVPGYTNPGAVVDHERGTLSWCSPSTAGIYNFVINVISLRRVYINGGTKVVLPIDTTEVELEVIIDACTQTAPIVTAEDTCVVAGSVTTLHYKASSSPSTYPVKVSYSGEPFSDSPPATFTTTGTNPVNAIFSWTTACPEVRANPYEVIVKGTVGVPDYNSYPPDTDFYTGVGTSEITVIGPPPPYVDATVDGTTVCLHWGPSPCTNTTGYNIYRHTGCYNFPRTACETGVPSSSGYVLVGTTTSLYDTTFCDSNGGAGLDPGVYYSYVVDATYPDSAAAVSVASPDTCVEIKRSVPLIINVSVTQTDISNGVMFVRWVKPELGVNGLDTNQYHGPYQYVLSHATGLTGGPYTAVTTVNSPFFKSLIDTTFSDVGLNTQQQTYHYKVDFYYTDTISGASKLVGSGSVASSIFTTLRRSSRTIYLNWSYAVPWNDSSFNIYRKDPTSTTYNFIGTSTGTSYTDTAGLLNGQNYCYYVESKGAYADITVLHPLFDSSQIICGIPEDTLPPCTPLLTVSPKCNLYEDSLVWTNPDNTCPTRNKVVYYEVFYTPTQGGDMSVIATITDPNDTLFVNSNLTSIAGCYAVVAVDSFGHITPIVSVCVDNCPQYVLPNVFTPNGDGNNDLFTPILPYRYVKDIDINIYNRWGTILFHTNNPMINWDGTDEHSHQPCPDGVYYYICTVNEIRVDGIKPVTLHGYVQIIR